MIKLTGGGLLKEKMSFAMQFSCIFTRAYATCGHIYSTLRAYIFSNEDEDPKGIYSDMLIKCVQILVAGSAEG